MQNPDPLGLHVGSRPRLARAILGCTQVGLVNFVQLLGRSLAPTPRNATP